MAINTNPAFGIEVRFDIENDYRVAPISGGSLITRAIEIPNTNTFRLLVIRDNHYVVTRLINSFIANRVSRKNVSKVGYHLAELLPLLHIHQAVAPVSESAIIMAEHLVNVLPSMKILGNSDRWELVVDEGELTLYRLTHEQPS